MINKDIVLFLTQDIGHEPGKQRGEYVSIYGDRLTKIYKFSKDDANLFESDVPETTRVISRFIFRFR